MSERIPTADDIRLALIAVGYTHYEADDAIEAVKRRTAHDRVAALLDTKETHERTICELRHDLAVARKERERLAHDLRRSLGHPKGDNAITLDALEAAWEAAEVADECREGDVLIIRDDEDNYLVRRMDDRSDLDSTARILSRAPKREPWAELAGVLKAHTGEPEPDETARMLYENGVRVTGGEES